MAGLRVLSFWLGKRVFKDVEMYRSDVLPHPAIAFAIMVLGIYLFSAGERNNTCWPGLSCCCSLALWVQSKYCFWFASLPTGSSGHAPC